MKLRKYRNRFQPETVFAVRWKKFGDHPEITEKMMDTEQWQTCGHMANTHGKLDLGNGRISGVCPGSWIICDKDGKAHGCCPDRQFRHIYVWYWRPW